MGALSRPYAHYMSIRKDLDAGTTGRSSMAKGGWGVTDSEVLLIKKNEVII